MPRKTKEFKGSGGGFKMEFLWFFEVFFIHRRVDAAAKKSCDFAGKMSIFADFGLEKHRFLQTLAGENIDFCNILRSKTRFFHNFGAVQTCGGINRFFKGFFVNRSFISMA
jgi:hypothetical protein